MLLRGLLLAAIVGGVGLLIWNAYFRPYHGPTVSQFSERVATSQTCEGMWGLRRSIDSARRDEGMTLAQWQRLQDDIADRARMLEPQMPAGEARGLCADLIVPCLPRGATCMPDLGG